jgi:hypothetical protein
MASSAVSPREFDPAARLRFAAFLERVAEHAAFDLEWQDAIVQHYADQLLVPRRHFSLVDREPVRFASAFG